MPNDVSDLLFLYLRSLYTRKRNEAYSEIYYLNQYVKSNK